MKKEEKKKYFTQFYALMDFVIIDLADLSFFPSTIESEQKKLDPKL